MHATIPIYSKYKCKYNFFTGTIFTFFSEIHLFICPIYCSTEFFLQVMILHDVITRCHIAPRHKSISKIFSETQFLHFPRIFLSAQYFIQWNSFCKSQFSSVVHPFVFIIQTVDLRTKLMESHPFPRIISKHSSSSLEARTFLWSTYMRDPKLCKIRHAPFINTVFSYVVAVPAHTWSR